MTINKDGFVAAQYEAPGKKLLLKIVKQNERKSFAKEAVSEQSPEVDSGSGQMNDSDDSEEDITRSERDINGDISYLVTNNLWHELSISFKDEGIVVQLDGNEKQTMLFDSDYNSDGYFQNYYFAYTPDINPGNSMYISNYKIPQKLHFVCVCVSILFKHNFKCTIIVIIVIIIIIIFSSSSWRTDSWVHFQQNAGQRQFVHT